MQRSVWVRHFEMCHIKVKKTKRRKKERDRAVECQQCRCFQHAVTLHVCTRVCVCACVCTSWLPMCLTNNHNLATLPRSRRRHFTLPSPWRSALPHTHTLTHSPAVRLTDTLITSEMPLVLPYLALFSFNTFQREHCTPIYLLHSAARMAYGTTNYYTLTMRRYSLLWLWRVGWIYSMCSVPTIQIFNFFPGLKMCIYL